MKVFWILVFLLVHFSSPAQQSYPGEWWFWPDYTLPGRANNYPGPRVLPPETPKTTISQESLPLIFYGEEPSERVTGFIDVATLPTEGFTLEMWLVDHVDQPIGVLAALKSKYTPTEPAWLLGIYDREIVLSVKTEASPFAQLLTYTLEKRSWKKYWTHLAVSFEKSRVLLYLDGEPVEEMKIGKLKPFDPAEMEVELASYMKNEPYMDLGNMLKCLRLYETKQAAGDIKNSFTRLQGMVEEGRLFPSRFHFNAGPYLNYVTQRSVNVIWETDRPSYAEVYYGKALPLTDKVVVDMTFSPETKGSPGKNIHKLVLDDLEPGQQYFYNIKAIDENGNVIESGNLTFATAGNENTPFSFAVIGDTEARPHINDRISKLVWDERPNFIVIVGDLTDGGMEHHKFEWNYEYFQGMNQLTSRIPVFPVAGNGEQDLYWYEKYHDLPSKDGYYSFRYGNAEFFMLNSNLKKEFAPGGEQYMWLEEKLKNSTALWKFVAHHHAPYSADENDYGDSWKGASALGDPGIRKIVPLYEKYKVDMVFFGHLHTYQRTLPILEDKINEKNGVVYIQGGGGGGNLEDFAPSRAWFSAKTYRGHHYFTVTVSGSRLEFKMYDSEGRMKDLLSLTK